MAHLRDGGTTPWAQWYGDAPATARVLPGAQQLELLRLLNAASAGRPSVRPSGRLPDGLAARVLGAAAPGRGKPDLPLTGVTATPYGPRPVDPADLPADELVRVATSVLAEDVAALGVSAPTSPPSRPWRRRYHLAGDPLVTAQVRDHLCAHGRPPGGAGTHLLVLGGPLDQMLADVWTRRCFERGSGGWAEWLRFWQQRGELPPRIDLPAVVERRRPATRRVTLVLDPAALPHHLGVRRLPATVRPGADAAELARRIATVLGLLVPPEERAALMSRTLWPRMPRGALAPVSIPDEHRDWVAAAADRMVRAVGRAGYPVVGDPAVLAPAPAGQPPAPARPDAAVLDLAVRMLVDQDWTKESR